MTLQEYAHAFIEGYATTKGFEEWHFYITVSEDSVQVKTLSNGRIKYAISDSMSRFELQEILVQAVKSAEDEMRLRFNAVICAAIGDTDE